MSDLLDFTHEELTAFDRWLDARPEQWYAYMFLAGDGEHVKIGRTMNLAARQQQLRSPRPRIVIPDFLDARDLSSGRMVYFETDGFRKEKAWHQHFAEYRVGGEWFLLCPDDDNLYGIPDPDGCDTACIELFIDMVHGATEAPSGWNPFDPRQHVRRGDDTAVAEQEQLGRALSAMFKPKERAS